MKSNLFSLSKLSLCLAVGALGFTSCGDDDDSGSNSNPSGNKTRTQLLTENSWRTTAATITVGTQTQDIFTGTDACDADDLLKLNAANNSAVSGSYEWNEGASKCDPSNPQVYETGTWAFQGNNQIVLTEGGFPDTYTIVELADNVMKISQSETDSATSTTYITNITFAAQ